MTDDTRVATIATIVAFLESIGLEVRAGCIEDRAFVPGVVIHHGALVFDVNTVAHPGDLLHEAGHLAVMEPDRRCRCHLDVGKRAAEEMMAIAWSYAAAVHLGVDPAVVFHADGYRGGSASLIENFTAGRYIGVPTLQWIGLTAEAKRAVELGVPPVPAHGEVAARLAPFQLVPPRARALDVQVRRKWRPEPYARLKRERH